MHTVSLLAGAIALLVGHSFADKSLSIDAKSNGAFVTAGAFPSLGEQSRLGFNIVRYNAGASSYNTYNGTRMVPKDPSSSSWDWIVDANQRAMRQKAKEREADTFELFSNSPMWWIHGTTTATQSTWQTLLTVQKDDWSITFQSVEAFNEPSSYYWKGDSGTQEGCFFTVSTMSTIIGYLKNELASRGLSAFIAGVDETSYDLAASTWQAFDDNARNTIKRINVHGYQGKKLWNSEYGDGDETGITLFTNLLLDFIWLHPTAWVYWQAVDISGWDLFVGDSDKEKAQKLLSERQTGDNRLSLVTGEVYDAQSLRDAFAGAYGVFAMTSERHPGKVITEEREMKHELDAGRNVVMAAKECYVEHLVFSSLRDIIKASDGHFKRIYHMNNKATIELLARKELDGFTALIPGFFYPNLFWPQYCRLRDVEWTDPEHDMGAFAAKIFGLGVEKTKGQTYLALSSKITPDSMVEIFTRVTGRPAVHSPISFEEFGQLSSSLVGPAFVDDAIEMMQWASRMDWS
ncbi:Dimethylglycine oxidase [Purpureocillium lavendulum]|uniref:Dimethylglycine oxidase n=1 Tax=Purpureocillium lavendulum TaxID=1247861 RepID=A0AB34FPB7_9HYPO|nr:Dimethylglycine oxidase [Purpureocillium lavendulum]